MRLLMLNVPSGESFVTATAQYIVYRYPIWDDKFSGFCRLLRPMADIAAALAHKLHKIKEESPETRVEAKRAQYALDKMKEEGTISADGKT